MLILAIFATILFGFLEEKSFGGCYSVTFTDTALLVIF
jgi:hypothetical protein